MRGIRAVAAVSQRPAAFTAGKEVVRGGRKKRWLSHMEKCSGKIFQSCNSAFSYLRYSLIFSNIICSSDLCSAVRIVLRS